MELKVLDINVWHGLYARTWWKVERLEPEEVKESRLRALVEALKALSPDVVTFQECFPQPAFGERVAAALDYDHVSYVSNAGIRIFGTGYPLGVDTGEGSTILAKRGLGLRSLGRISLSGSGLTGKHVSFQVTDKRVALACEVKVGGKPVTIVTCHVRYEWAEMIDFHKAWQALTTEGLVTGAAPPALVKSVQSNLSRRDGELDVLASWVERLAKENEGPWLISGDLNIDDEAPQIARLVSRLKMTSVLASKGVTGRTWDPAANPNIARSSSYTYVDGSPKDASALVVAYHDKLAQRPDHIFVASRLADAIVDARVVLTEPVGGIHPSDHFGIWTTLAID